MNSNVFQLSEPFQCHLEITEAMISKAVPFFQNQRLPETKNLSSEMIACYHRLFLKCPSQPFAANIIS